MKDAQTTKRNPGGLGGCRSLCLRCCVVCFFLLFSFLFFFFQGVMYLLFLVFFSTPGGEGFFWGGTNAGTMKRHVLVGD